MSGDLSAENGREQERTPPMSSSRPEAGCRASPVRVTGRRRRLQPGLSEARTPRGRTPPVSLTPRAPLAPISDPETATWIHNAWALLPSQQLFSPTFPAQFTLLT